MRYEDIEIEFLGHDGFLIVWEGKKIVIDPFKISNNACEKIGKADYIFITHSHYDHCSIEDIGKLVKHGTKIIVTPDAQSKVNRFENVEIGIASPGLKLKSGEISVYPFPAYNLDKDFHPQDEGWVGYLLKLGNVIIYHTGDSDKIPEMVSIKGINVEGEKILALLPVSGKYVMTAEEAVEAAEMITPDLAIPMHYSKGVIKNEEEIKDAEKFVSLCNEKGISAKILEIL